MTHIWRATLRPCDNSTGYPCDSAFYSGLLSSSSSVSPVKQPSYLADDCQLVSDVHPRRLRSSNSLTCVVQCTRNTYSDQCFAAAGPLVWNSLPAELQQCHSLEQFKRHLKTHFSIYRTTVLCDFLVKQCHIEILLLTYLLSHWSTIFCRGCGNNWWPLPCAASCMSLFLLSSSVLLDTPAQFRSSLLISRPLLDSTHLLSFRLPSILFAFLSAF